MHINKTALNGGLHKHQVAITTQHTPKKTTNFKIRILSQPTTHSLPIVETKTYQNQSHDYLKKNRKCQMTQNLILQYTYKKNQAQISQQYTIQFGPF